MGRLIAKIAEDCQAEDFANGNDGDDGNWVEQMAKATGTPQKTLYNWWKSFCQETARSITPKQATNDDRARWRKTTAFDFGYRRAAEYMAASPQASHK